MIDVREKQRDIEAWGRVVARAVGESTVELISALSNGIQRLIQLSPELVAVVKQRLFRFAGH